MPSRAVQGQKAELKSPINMPLLSTTYQNSTSQTSMQAFPETSIAPWSNSNRRSSHWGLYVSNASPLLDFEGSVIGVSIASKSLRLLGSDDLARRDLSSPHSSANTWRWAEPLEGENHNSPPRRLTERDVSSPLSTTHTISSLGMLVGRIALSRPRPPVEACAP